ncbi:hypothetical protein [Bartonella phoceensis]|nr:hypothetical protein [Bartonella phoceensis]
METQFVSLLMTKQGISIVPLAIVEQFVGLLRLLRPHLLLESPYA